MRSILLSSLLLTVMYGCAHVNASWSDWTDWSACSETCNTGDRTRTRTCNVTSGSPCTGSDSETMACLIMNYCIPSYYGNTDLSCGQDYFGCATGVTQCIEMSERCDGSFDCEDGSDENPYFTNCTTTTFCQNGSNGVHTTVYTSVLLATISLLCVVSKN